MIVYGVLSLIGIILVIHPDMIIDVFGYYTIQQNNDISTPIDIKFIIGIILGCCVGLLQVMVCYILGDIARHIQLATSVFYWGLFALLYGGFGCLYIEFNPWDLTDLFN